jgi:hypothetical protein
MNIKRVDTPHGRVYMVKDEDGIKLYPSVTTVLSSEPQPWLEKLASDIGQEELAKISERAANRGSVMHTYLENYLVCMGYRGPGDECLLYSQKKTAKELNEQYDPQTMERGRNLFYDMLESDLFVRMKRPLFSEKFLWSHQHMFAGTADFGYVDTTPVDGDIIGDFKSASSPRGEEQVSKYKKQLGAYSIAYEERTGRKVKRAEVWISYGDGIQTIILEGEELEEAKRNFLTLCENYHRNWNKKPILEYLKALKDSKKTTHGSESGDNT